MLPVFLLLMFFPYLRAKASYIVACQCVFCTSAITALCYYFSATKPAARSAAVKPHQAAQSPHAQQHQPRQPLQQQAAIAPWQRQA